MHDLTVNRHARELERQVRQRTAELADERRRYKTLVQEINDGFFVIDNYKIHFANPAFCRMHGVSVEEAVGRPFLSFVAPASRPLVRAAYREALTGRKSPQRLEYKRLGCPPELTDTEIRSRVVDLGQGRVIIGICRDISERLAMEAKVREHERLAYLGQLTASLSHEIRNPLSAIKLNMQILSRKLDLDGFDRRRLDITAREVTRLEEIMRQLLDTARPAGLEQIPVDLAELVRAAVELLEPKLGEGGIRLRQSHARSLPRALGDPGGLQQAVQNLLLNAMEAAGRGGGVRVWTRLASPRRERCLEIGVSDNGPGIAAEDLPRLFTPFFTNRDLGTGLGLFNVKRIAEAHGGSVVVKSRPGHGASFVLRLPCLP
jgi:PAS domain S-box-containing protein